MSLVKTHKGVNIHVSPDGEFYCDAASNSSEYVRKTFKSAKLASIEKAIDQYTGQDINGPVYYKIELHLGLFKKVKVVKRIGSRLFFDDGTDTLHHFHSRLYPESITESSEFEKLQNLFKELTEVRTKYEEYYRQYRALSDKASEVLKRLPKVEVKAE